MTSPTYRSQALTAIARSIASVHDGYMSKRQAEELRLNFTPQGRQEARAADAGEAFERLRKLRAEARRAGEEAVASALAKASAALREVAPKLDAASAILAVEAARMLQADPSQRARLLNLARQRALDDADAEIAALLIHVPSRLTGLTPADRDTLRVALVPDEATALFVAKDELRLIEQHVGTVAEAIARHADHWSLPAELSEAVAVARAAASIGHVEQPASLDDAEPPSSLEDDAAEQPPAGDETEAAEAA